MRSPPSDGQFEERSLGPAVGDGIPGHEAEIKADLTRRNRPGRRRALDPIVAATALEDGLTLVTRNGADYRQIRGLSLY